jgi:multisubunit Na+/H+ antiporter MnhE subunit
MTIVLATTFAMVLWIVLWATGTKAFDAAMLAVGIVVVVATGRIMARYLPGRESS